MLNTLAQEAPLHLTTLLIRRPILDRKGQLYGYELKTDEQSNPMLTDKSAAKNRLLHDLLEIGIPTLIGNSIAFITLSSDMFVGYWNLLPPGTHVFLRLGKEGVSRALIDALRRSKTRNLSIIMDDIDLDPTVFELQNLSQVIPIIRFVADGQIATLAERIKAWQHRSVQLLVTRIDTRQAYQTYLDLGADYFEGPYLFEPEIILTETIKNNRLSVLRLLAVVDKPSNGPRDVEAVLRTDPGLSYKLLRFLNSAYFGLRKKLTSLAQATVYLGMEQLRQWVSLLALSSMENQSSEVIKGALIRAHMCEDLCKKSSKEFRDMAFMTGMFSALDVLLGMPMEAIVEHLPLADEVRAALLQEPGSLTALLQQVIAFESGNWEEFSDNDFPPRRFAEAYWTAVEFAETVGSSLPKKYPQQSQQIKLLVAC